MISPWWPAHIVSQLLACSAMFVANGTFLARTFLHPKDSALKKVFGAVRGAKCSLVLGDWLATDYDERLNQVQYFDALAVDLQKGGAELSLTTKDGEGGENGNGRGQSLSEFVSAVKNVPVGTLNRRPEGLSV